MTEGTPEMKKICAIITGGEYCPLRNIKEASFVIACDKGYSYALSSGITPDAVLGDFDSHSVPDSDNIDIVVLPKEKDDTDTMFAVRYALERAPDEIYFYCAEGGRPDHFIGNIQAAAFAAKNGITARIFGNGSDYRIFSKGIQFFPKDNFSQLSALSLSDECRGVCINGAAYPLDRALLGNCFPVGISNEWTESVISVSVESGIMMVICTQKEPYEHI